MIKEELTKLLMESYERGQSDMIKACHETISIAVDTAILVEREACAKVCEGIAIEARTLWKARYEPHEDGRSDGAFECAEAIRARGNVATNDTSQERVDKTSESVHEPMHPQLKAMLEEYFDKCFAESAPQRTWVGLTDEEISLIDWESLATKKDCVRAIEAKLKEKNNG